MENKLSVTINGRMYTLVSDESREYMEKLSEYVNENVNKVKDKNPALLGERPIVLAALNICDELFKAEQGGKIMIDRARHNYDEMVLENKRLREIVNNSGYEIDMNSMKQQLESAKAEIERLRRQLYNR